MVDERVIFYEVVFLEPEDPEMNPFAYCASLEAAQLAAELRTPNMTPETKSSRITWECDEDPPQTWIGTFNDEEMFEITERRLLTLENIAATPIGWNANLWAIINQINVDRVDRSRAISFFARF